MKKTFSKFLATAAAVSMLASVATVVNADDTAVEAPAYNFTFRTVEAGAIITGVENAAEATEITIPAEVKATTTNENGEAVETAYAVVGIDNLAFADLTTLAVVNAPSSITLENMGDVAFITKTSIAAYLEAELGMNPYEVTVDNKDAVVNYIAAEFKYNDKEAEWTTDELAEVAAKFQNKAKLAGATEDMNIVDAVALMIKNEAAMNLSEATAAKFDLWVNSITYTNMAVLAEEGSAIAEYVKGKELLGLKSSVALLGDANLDGEVSVRDCATIAKALAKGAEDVAKLPACSDYNQDGEITVRDAAALARELAKKK